MKKKKDGVMMSFLLEKSIVEKLKEYADERGQTYTKAIERILIEKFRTEEEKNKKNF